MSKDVLKLITGNDTNVSMSKLREITLDELWREAETLGRIGVERNWEGTSYKVEIRFRRKSGTRINAIGEHSAIHEAIGRAIDEAREMGAGVES